MTMIQPILAYNEFSLRFENDEIRIAALDYLPFTTQAASELSSP
jgi:hypothetical protein